MECCMACSSALCLTGSDLCQSWVVHLHSTLQQATIDMGVSAAGKFSQQDYFKPYEYASLDGGDIDFGSSGAALLSPFFSGGGVSQVIVAGGKSGKIYFMDANNLGGFTEGGGRGDAGTYALSFKSTLYRFSMSESPRAVSTLFTSTR